MDFLINDFGSIFSVVTLTENGIDWVNQYIDVPDYETPETFNIEVRYAQDIIGSMLQDGLQVSLDGKNLYINCKNEVGYFQ